MAIEGKIIEKTQGFFIDNAGRGVFDISLAFGDEALPMSQSEIDNLHELIEFWNANHESAAGGPDDNG